MNNFSQRITALSPEQRSLLELRLKQKQGKTSVIPKIIADKNHNLMASFAQQRMWFQDQLGVKSATSNNMPVALKINGLLQVKILEQSIREIIRRHAILRTTLKTVNKQLIQVIADDVNFTLPLIDLRSLPKSEREQKAQQLAIEEACKPFDLAGNLFLRVTLIHLDTTEYMMLMTMHHIVSDAWSVGVFFRELNILYQAFISGQHSPLAELPIQYADFAVWQRQATQGTQLKKEIAYWKQQLQGAATLLQLPTDRLRSPTPSFAGKMQSFILPKTLIDALKAISQQSEATLFMTLLTAFKILLYRYTRHHDILVGSPSANRHQPETENLIGCFINTLVLRSNLSGNPSFRELLNQVREVVLDAFSHQNLPFEKLVDELQLGRNLSYLPLFQVLFVMQNATSSRDIELPGLDVSYSLIDNQTAQFDITLHLVEEQSGLIGRIGYDTELFDDSTITRMIGHFQTLLAGIVANSNQRVSQLPLLTPSEHQQLLEWNKTDIDFPQEICIHQLFTNQVEKTPDAIAVVFEDQNLTYQELNQQANQLAHYLQKLGVKPEVLVGICVDRSIAMVVGILGILKAGGAYVPLDPAYPQQRIASILSDSQVSVILTQQHLLADLPEIKSPVVCLDKDWELISQQHKQNPTHEILAENLVYVIYTSGSTGNPKGVMITHRNLVNAYLGWEDAYQLRSLCSSHLQMASFSFDVFSGDMVRALCSGAKLVICKREWLLEPEKLYKLMNKEKIDCAEFVPVVLKHLIQYLEKTEQKLDLMKLLAVGSDSWYAEDYLKIKHFLSPETRLINSYGVSEATIDSSYFETEQGNLLIDGLVPIGRPFPNTKFYILDAYLQLVPIGITGELYISSIGLARGYLNQPELTEQKFIPSPFDNTKLYKTGDLARYLADGNVEFLGRVDHQVKIRGFRIELGEVESVLTQHPSVLQSVVLDQEDQSGNKRLVAYVVAEAEHIPTTSDLRYFIEKKLPNYMIPAVFVMLKALPLNPNGKVDRRALPIPETHRPELSETFVKPRTFTEKMIAEIFSQVIGVNQVGIYDDFFELGGNSLLVIQLITQLSEALQVELTIVDLFEVPTVAGLAERIERMQIIEQFSFALVEQIGEREEIEI
ncbi:non-ribosomal peptide synthetase [Calothrix sp. PCC 7507]|uniref:non-ribosomal peptide synthetase n=1 Tax=Calothrix sp. PCC 7507 TaxID=99598 RepID=UPI00029F2EFC|nr:non-ribosomal peptide synthetase [Calothrix sp. PCC 7507]AFY33173.1 amino acid adenylation domain protein [Calothrix sp. PCC 7507]